ncbi:hypothetical protein [Streptomyces sp. NPDC047071]|uniref:hypothetical protein n=1 Tax=Streptomyces sp. NPDC047071 TaxID=3154808 RepID=UPI0034534DAF
MRTSRTAAAVTAVVALAAGRGGSGGEPVPTGPAAVAGKDVPRPQKYTDRGTR